MLDRIPNCNGCGACVLGCNRLFCIRMEKDENGRWKPVINENTCDHCNNCFLYCPLYNPVSLPSFSDYFEYDESYYDRDMGQVLRETLRKAKTGEATQFAGTLCQIAALKSVMGDRIRSNVQLYPLHCDPEQPKRPECANCEFIKR